jgi:hypothetical protein
VIGFGLGLCSLQTGHIYHHAGFLWFNEVRPKSGLLPSLLKVQPKVLALTRWTILKHQNTRLSLSEIKGIMEEMLNCYIERRLILRETIMDGQ